MRNRKIQILVLVFLMLSSAQLFASGNNVATTTPIWLYLLAALLLILIVIALILINKKRRNALQLEKLQASLKTLNQELLSLRENKKEIILQRIEALRDEIKAREHNLEAMKKTLKASKLSASRNSFLLTKISQTLRTNLNDILGFSLLLENEFALSEEEELFEYNENIRKSGASLMHLLNNIIDISKIESKSFRLKEEACHLADISEELIRQYQPVATLKGIKIVFQDNKVPPFAADCETVRHILSNLLDNSVNYTEKGFIKISQTVKDEMVVWTIKDTGIGIDKAYLPDIFEPFRQQSLGYSKLSNQGAGLGLPLIKNMLELMNGKINIESEKVKGTTVTVYLPFMAFSEQSTPTPKETATPKKKNRAPQKATLKRENIKILILDEDRLGNMLIKKILPKVRIESYSKETTPEIWINQQLVNQSQPDILMVELDFTGNKKGTAVLQKLKKKYPELERVPTIALSAYPDSNGYEKAIQQGFTAYLQKPFHKKDLINLLNQLIST